MKVYCIDGDDGLGVTSGEFYNVVSNAHWESSTIIVIANDYGVETPCMRRRFATPDQYREIQLDKIL